jgi:hypothetical protein
MDFAFALGARGGPGLRFLTTPALPAYCLRAAMPNLVSLPMTALRVTRGPGICESIRPMSEQVNPCA